MARLLIEVIDDSGIVFYSNPLKFIGKLVGSYGDMVRVLSWDSRSSAYSKVIFS